MAPNNNLRSVIAQCRHLSTRSRRNVSSSRSNNGNNNGNVLFFQMYQIHEHIFFGFDFVILLSILVLEEGRRRVMASGDGFNYVNGFLSSLTYGNLAFCGWAIIELLEFRRTMMRDVEERNRRLGVRGEPPEILRDMLIWILQ
ncbi:hypothetical protein ISN45_Aa03g011540 [Arabidopsis thaliana x Arabidopsis arenosa]|uniref:Transmembrane protein n=1 Tax=Arabidopsis thaliana x Arabidopsis arenosa TaxID=1240361 RepID=A0A8T2AUF6_9BRAS|nr:hypothetical protein ISN45_Aa03g011540 [Arabidopsis thaliana x Arabidopsis arenosa]